MAEAPKGEPRTVVVISHNAPPRRNAGAARIEGLVRHLPESGWRVALVTSVFSGQGQVAGAETARVSEPLVAFRRRVAGRPETEDAPGPPGRLKRLVLERFAVPDLHVGWVPGAALAATRLARARDASALLSSSPSESSHLAALVASLLTGLPWVAEFRDGWIVDDLKDLDRHPVRRRMEVSLERLVARRASHLVGVSRPIAADLERRFGAATWVSNGFDEEPPPETAFEEARRLLDPDCFNLVYTGTFSRSRAARSPAVLAAALGEVSSDRGARRVCLTVVGHVEEAERALLEGAGARVVAERPRPVVAALQRLADALVLVTVPGETSIPGKLFEYVGSGRPMLALAAGNPAGDLVAELGGGLVVPADDVAAVAEGIRRLVSSDERGRDAGDPDLARFTRRNLALRLAGVLDEAVRAQ